tara:strand:+ start:291 stop:581 length:291 start_codon:yes stop_codon:yes gene_type:complete
MKSVTITVGDYDILVIEKIFENEKGFEPRDPRDELLIKIMKQIIENPKIDLGGEDYPGNPMSDDAIPEVETRNKAQQEERKENPYPFEPKENVKFT